MMSRHAADTPTSGQARIIMELKRISTDRKRSKEDRAKAERAYRSLTQTMRTSSIQ